MTAERKKRRFWKRVIILAIVWIFVLPLIAFVVFGVIGLRAANAPVASQPQVPNLKGLQIETAQKTGHQAGFQVELAGKDFDSGEKPGTVINQESWIGSRKETVSMTVSTNTNRPPLRAVDIGTLTNPHNGEV